MIYENWYFQVDKPLRLKRSLHAGGCERLFELINRNASARGMKVNPSKTQFMCVSSSIFYDVSSYIDTADGRICSQNSLTVLGFAFGDRPTMEAHVSLIQKKFAARFWMIFHLKQKDVPAGDLVSIYSTIIRSAIEYAVSVYHHMLTADQSERLERLQRKVLKLIFRPRPELLWVPWEERPHHFRRTPEWYFQKVRS